ncbi:MAG: hypothetical protein JKY66_01575 [Spongiibacteraceae bacterium]|nr:hypothetical protein [Spongiibacteraceae bacterium]
MSISIAVRASFYMALYLVGLHTLLMIALLLLVSGLLLQTLAVVLVVCSLLYSLWRYATDHSICWIKRISYQESCWILLTKGGECSASLQQATVWRCSW